MPKNQRFKLTEEQSESLVARIKACGLSVRRVAEELKRSSSPTMVHFYIKGTTPMPQKVFHKIIKIIESAEAKQEEMKSAI